MPRGLGSRTEDEKEEEKVATTPPETQGSVTVVTEEKVKTPSKKELIRVKPAKQDGRVVLWERDGRHPKGECFLAGDEKEYDVFPTPAILQAIANGTLLRVNWNS